MDQQHIREQLDELAALVADLQAAPSDKARLSALVDDIEQQLSGDSDSDGEAALAAEQASMAEQVDTLVAAFETDHPAVAGVLKNIMVTLTSMGV